MPPFDSDTGSSPETTPTTTASLSPAPAADTQASASPGDPSASPPDAPVIDDRAALLEVVRKAVEANPKNSGSEGDKAAPELTGTAPEPETPAATDAPEDDPSEDELKSSHPKTKARIEKLLAQRNTARTETEGLKPAAAKWQQMDGYLQHHDLAAEDVNLLLGVGAALRRGDFKAFLDGVGPYVDLANQALGRALPSDLQTKVESGEMSDDAARELSVARVANARLQGQAQAQATAATERTQQETNQRAAQAVQSAVTEWEQQVQARDPDYAKKASLVVRISQALVAQHGVPATPGAAVELAKAAYEEANGQFAAFRPVPVPTRPAPLGAQSGSSNGRPEPKSLMDAARLGLARARGE